VKIDVPELSLAVLIGITGSGKSTFAARHFKPTEVLSSDYFRGLVSDDENDQSATVDAFEALHYVAGKRLAAGRFTVIDATNVQRESRQPLVALARQEYPRHEGLRLAAGDQLADVVGPDVEWRAPAGREVVVGDNDLLPVAFLETGAAIAKSVVRIALGERQYGSGFLIAPDLVLTNQHVLPSLEVAQRAVIELGCQETLAGVAIAGVPHATRAGEVYAADEAADWAVVKIEPVAGCTPISLAAGDLAVPKVGERVYIIQHPGGGPKEVALGDNAVTYVDDQRIQYLTDTRPGSSGSPVFDRRWRLVALHHSGGWMTEGDDPNAKDLKFRNEGVPIGVVRAALVKARLVQ